MRRKLLELNHKKVLDRGFTTFEILISIIIALAFVSVAMQSFVLSMAMKVQAQEKQRANQLIQEDLERIGELATLIRADHANKCNPVATAADATATPPVSARTAYQNGYAYELWEDLIAVTAPTVNRLVAADGTGTGKTLTLVRNQINDLTDPSPTSDAPYRTLKINYQVTVSPDDDVVAERYVEVIPDVALLCP